MHLSSCERRLTVFPSGAAFRCWKEAALQFQSLGRGILPARPGQHAGACLTRFPPVRTALPGTQAAAPCGEESGSECKMPVCDERRKDQTMRTDRALVSLTLLLCSLSLAHAFCLGLLCGVAPIVSKYCCKLKRYCCVEYQRW